MEPHRAGIPGKKIADDFCPRGNDFFLTQPGLESEFRRELDKHFANRESSIRPWLGLRQPAPLLNHPFTERLRHEIGTRPDYTAWVVAKDTLTAAIAADRFHRAAFHRLFTEGFLVRALRLLVDV